jgi:XTP/dITP diphosphohydrolase
MFRLVLATENKDKAKEIASILSEELPVEILTLADFPGVNLPPEEGKTYRENAATKAMTVARATGLAALGDDTGLEVEALSGAPGLYSARYAGEGATYADNRKKLLNALSGLPPENRSARFLCTVAIAWPDGRVEVVEGICPGRINERESGADGFGYDPVFFVPECGKTFAALSPDEKNRVSHRGRAIRAAAEILKKMDPIADQ